MATRKANRKGYRYLPVDEETGAGALLTNDVVASDWDSVVDDTLFALSLKATWSMTDHTAVEGPLIVGVAHSDYTAAEIEECLEAIASWDRGDQIAQEHRRRKVRQVGVFPGQLAQEVLNDGLPIKTKIGWLIEPGETLATWIWNKDDNTLTTGTLIQCQGGLSTRKA